MCDCYHGVRLSAGRSGWVTAKRCACRHCSECGDTGERYDAEAERFEPCSCLPLRWAIRRLNRTGIPARYAGSRFDRLECPPELLEGWSAAAALAAGDTIWLEGPTRSRKTRLLVAAVIEGTVLRGRQYVYVSWPNAVSVLHLDQYDPEKSRWDALIENPSHLVLDDLAPVGRLADERLRALVRRRTDACWPTSVATRLTPARLGETLGDEVVSRLPGASVVLPSPPEVDS